MGEQILNVLPPQVEEAPISMVANSFNYEGGSLEEEVEQSLEVIEEPIIVLGLQAMPINFMPLELQPHELNTLDDSPGSEANLLSVDSQPSMQNVELNNDRGNSSATTDTMEGQGQNL
jgi:hypothetical protein